MKASQEILDFLEEYRKLCEKYNLSIGACGCCNSPWVVSGDPYIGHLKSELDWSDWGKKPAEIEKEAKTDKEKQSAAILPFINLLTIMGVSAIIVKMTEGIIDAEKWDFSALPHLEARK